ncbi:lytic transglycosylase domain-containing protein [Celeribacter marinus]|uniref:Membrane-bound lytic murein transglycosylase D n=1 Tax=Celeribacter marinus TaxID=1397108 RepID=A0A0N9ZIX9_9RHOB|nr:lytic transglycosylase domain-containing protein [Celeribacter marinus]ALI56634.1 membrane-bound lytic murein transglycosylase D precursor [Celeribacter marinus]SFK61370.1 Transglycosylase SLT domain-containing protein [Celeribacter marinus]
MLFSSTHLRAAVFAGLCGGAVFGLPAFAQDIAGPIVPKTLGGTTVTTKPAWGKVTPKRIGVPVGGASKRITVQIRPTDIARQQGEGAGTAPNTVRVSTDPEVPADLQDWFWNAVPHDVTGAAPERFALALKALDAPQAAGLSKPTFQQVTDIANAYGTDLLVHSIGTQVSPALALAVMAVESAGKADAQSGAGAQGLMQLIPATAERFGVTDSMNPSENIKGGIAYLDWLLTHFNGDLALALSGYNAGENAVSKHQGPPPYAETRAYVPKVLAAWQVARGLCVTPPDLYSDGCVFATNALRSE